MNKFCYSLAFLVLATQYVFGQVKVSGTVTSKDDGQPLPGVSVVVDGTQKGTVTDFDGKYLIDVRAGSVLVFTFVGMIEKKILVTSSTGGSVVIDVALDSDDQVLDDVVVTALGIKRETRTLTYAQQNVKAIRTYQNQRN